MLPLTLALLGVVAVLAIPTVAVAASAVRIIFPDAAARARFQPLVQGILLASHAGMYAVYLVSWNYGVQPHTGPYASLASQMLMYAAIHAGFTLAVFALCQAAVEDHTQPCTSAEEDPLAAEFD